MSSTRHLDWPGVFNVRDLGGLAAAGGRRTASGALVRADSLSRLSQAGWAALVEYGIRTVVDLRNDAEREQSPDVASRPELVTTVQVPIDGSEDHAFWAPIERSPEFGTPLYYRAHLMRKPQLSAAALRAIARAQPGGVVVHCVAGRDRSGMVAMLALSLLGVSAQDIGEDYGLSDERLQGLWQQLGMEDPAPELAAFLAQRGTNAREVIATTLCTLDVEATLRSGGLSDEDLAALRHRLLEPADDAS